MFFSRVRIDQLRLEQIDFLRILQGNAYSAHKLIWKLFPGDGDADRDYLFRQEFEKDQIPFDETRRGLPLFYIVSHRKPFDTTDVFRIETKEYSPLLENGMRLQFDLRVNPTIQEKVARKNVDEWINNRRKLGFKEKPPTKLRRYHDVLMQAKMKAKKDGVTDTIKLNEIIQTAAIEWINSAGVNSGFSIEKDGGEYQLVVSAYQQQVIRKNSRQSIQFSSIEYNGILKITDAGKFKNALFNGIGRSKAFGCGLMLVKKV